MKRGGSEKAKERAQDVAASGAMLPTSIQVFMLHCARLVRYRAQFVPRDREVAAAYRVGAQRICVATWMAFPPAVLQNTDLPQVTARLELRNAARWTTMGRSMSLQSEWNRCDAALQGDDAALAVEGDRVFRREWHAHSSITARMRAAADERMGVLQAA